MGRRRLGHWVCASIPPPFSYDYKVYLCPRTKGKTEPKKASYRGRSLLQRLKRREVAKVKGEEKETPGDQRVLQRMQVLRNIFTILKTPMQVSAGGLGRLLNRALNYGLYPCAPKGATRSRACVESTGMPGLRHKDKIRSAADTVDAQADTVSNLGNRRQIAEGCAVAIFIDSRTSLLV